MTSLLTTDEIKRITDEHKRVVRYLADQERDMTRDVEDHGKLLAHIAAVEEKYKWKDISTAPKDDPKLVYEIWHRRMGYPVAVTWVEHYGCWVTPDRERQEIKESATHWRYVAEPEEA